MNFAYPEGEKGKIGRKIVPLEIIGDFVFESSGGIDLPLNEFLLKPIAGNLTQSLNIYIHMDRNWLEEVEIEGLNWE